MNALPPHDIKRLSVGLLTASGPTHAAMPTLALDRSAVADTAIEKVAYYHRYARRSIALAITVMDMAITTIDHITAMATDGPMVMDMGVAGVTKTPHPIAG